MRKGWKWLALSGLIWHTMLWAAVSVTDDDGKTVTLPYPAQRIISFSPHLTEMLYAIGAGDRLVGVTLHSDYPEAARSLPVVGDFRQIDLEQILVLKPDLLLVWSGGRLPRQIAALERAGIPVFRSHPKHLEDIPDTMRRLGRLTGRRSGAYEVARQWHVQLDELVRQYRHRSPLRVFYQVSEVPLFTVNGEQIVNEAIALCGGDNVFASLPFLAPHVSEEAVLLADPEVILGTRGAGSHDDLSGWRRYPVLSAVRYGNLFHLNPDWLDRPGPRMIIGVDRLCRKLDEARRNRKRMR